MKKRSQPSGRRAFLKAALSAVAAAPVVPALASAAEGVRAAACEQPPPVYQCLGPDEALFVETLVDIMCPADALTPRGVECGLSTFIDRQLASGWGRGERMYLRGPWRPGKPEQGPQLPLTPEQFFRAGIAAVEALARAKLGMSFAQAEPAAAEALLQEIAAGKVSDARVPLAEWFNTLVYPLFLAGCYADPSYGGNRDKIFWKLVGYPGLPAFYANDFVKFRGKRYPGAQSPKSLVDFG